MLGQRGLLPSALPYNLSISHRYQFLWFRVAKVGTRSILRQFEDHDVPLDVQHAMWIHYPTTLFKDYFKFAFVRHPWGRLLSCWRNKVHETNHFGFDPTTHRQMQELGNFVDWVQRQDLRDCDHHICLQSRLIDLTQVDFLGRLESFEADFMRICETLGIRCSGVRIENETKKAPEHDQRLQREFGDRICRIYERDCQIFGYGP